MSGTLNKVMLIGHLGDEVKLHYFYTNKQTGEKVTTTEWHNIVVRNKAAEICEKYLSKGDKIYVEGRLKTRQWQGEDGVTKYTTEIHVQDFTFLTSKQESMSGEQQTASKKTADTARAPQAQKPEPTGSMASSESDDDLPF